MIHTLPCTKCHTVGITSEHNAFKCDENGNLRNAEDLAKITTGTLPGEIRPCYSCNGFGVTKEHGAYKTLDNAKAGVARKTARRCYGCEKGYRYTVRVMEDRRCYSCSGVGHVMDYVPGETFDTDLWSHCDSMSEEAGQHFAERVNIVIVREDRGMTWGESYLGLGSIWSCTDYGDMAKRNVEQMEAHIRANRSMLRTQWVNVIHPDTKIITDTIVVSVTRNGYIVSGAGCQRFTIDHLPETYTPAVLNRAI